MFEKPLKELPPLAQIVLLLLLCLLSGALFSMIAMVSSPALTGFGLEAMLSAGAEDVALLPTMWYFQGMTALGLFVLPGLLFSYYWDHDRPFAPLGWQQRLSARTYLLTALVVVSSGPLIYALYDFTANLPFPESWAAWQESIRAGEEQAEKTIGLLLSRADTTAVLLNLLILVLIPAVGEELIFRGLLQRMLLAASGKPHLAIWISAALFSAIHFQWFGFVPRMLLGACFGYLVFWTGSLLPAIFGHLINNGLAVLGEYAMQQKWVDWDVDSLMNLPWYVLLLSTAGCAVLLYGLYGQAKKMKFERLD